MKRTKRILSLFLSVLLLLSCVPATVFAADADHGLVNESLGKAKLEFTLIRPATDEEKSAPDYDGSGYVPMSSEEISALTAYAGSNDLNEGDSTNANGWSDATETNTFLLGIKAVNFDNIKHMTDTAGTGRLRSLTFHFNYNADYLKAEPKIYAYNEDEGGVAFIKDDWSNAILDRLGANANSSFIKSNKYTYVAGAQAKDLISSDHSTTDKTGTNWKSLYISCVYSSDTGAAQFTGANDEYLAICEFGVVNVPENGANAFTKLDFCVDSASLDIGRDTKTSYQAGTMSDSELATVLEYEDSTADPFPIKYTLTFHDNNANLPGNPSTVTSIEGQEQMIQHDMSAKEYATDGLLNAGKKPVVPGYVFKYWTTDTAAQTDPAGDYTPFTVDTKVTANADLYAVYGEGYALTFDPNGGSFGDGSTIAVEKEFAKGTSITAAEVPVAPTRTDDYDFAGWNTVANGSGDSMADANAVEAHDFADTSATLYAQWTPTGDDIVTVEFDDNFAGASTNTVPSAAADPVQVNRNDSLGSKMPTAPQRGGYSFKGWNTVQNGTGKTITDTTRIDPGEGNDTLTVYAQWKILDTVEDENKVTITFHADDADAGTCPDPIVLHKNDKLGAANLPANPTRTGRAFNYWAKDSAAGEAFDADNTVLATDVDLYAVWKNKVTITFDARTSTGATVTGSPELTHELDAGDTVPDSVFTTINAAIQAPTGYTFNGKWNTAENGAGTEVNNTYKVDDTVTAYAVYEADSATAMDVIFDANHTTDPNVYETRSVYKEETIHKTVGFPADPTREGYSFTGWYTEQIGGEKVDDTTTETVAELAGEGATSLTLYAHWGIDSESGKTEDDYYTISFYSNINKTDRDAADQLIDEVKVLKGETLTVGSFVPTRAGFDFADKWNDTSENTFDFTVAPTADTKLYAIWKADLTFEFDETPVVYTGSDIAATITTLTGKDGTDLKDILRDGTDYKIVYSDGTTTTANVINVGEYDFELIDATEDHTALGLAKIVNADELKLTATTPDKFAVNPGKINFELTEAGSQVKSTDGNTEVEPSIGIVDGPTGIDFTLSYSKWVDAGEMDKKIEESELTPLGDGVKPSEYGKYVVAITLTGDDVANYEIGELTGITLYQIADGGTFAKGSNIEFEVKPSAQLTGIKFAQKDSEGTDLGEVGVYEEKDLQTAVDPVPSTGGKYYAETKPEATTDIVLEGTLPEGTLEVEVNGTKLVDGQDGVTITRDENGVTITGVTLKPATGESTNDGFDNTIKVTVGGTTVYEVEVCQLVVAEIKLLPGNSPYGLIERMAAKYHGEEGAWDADTITAAKAAFDEGNKFAAGYVPDGGVEGVLYSPRAWFGVGAIDPGDLVDSTKNMDRNPLAQFVYNTIDFLDAGFEVYDTKGKKVENPEVKLEVKVRRLNTNSIDYFVDDRSIEETLLLEADESGMIPAFAKGGNNPIRPDKYELVYTWTDPVTKEVAATATRAFIIVNRLGDMDSSKTVDGSDVTKIKDINSGTSTPFVDVPASVQNLHEMRTMDVDGSGTLDGSDVTKIKDINAGSTEPIVYYYNLSK